MAVAAIVARRATQRRLALLDRQQGVRALMMAVYSAAGFGDAAEAAVTFDLYGLDPEKDTDGQKAKTDNLPTVSDVLGALGGGL